MRRAQELTRGGKLDEALAVYEAELKTSPSSVAEAFDLQASYESGRERFRIRFVSRDVLVKLGRGVAHVNDRPRHGERDPLEQIIDRLARFQRSLQVFRNVGLR